MLVGYAPIIGATDHQTWFFIPLVLLLVIVLETIKSNTKGVAMMVISNLSTEIFVNLTAGLVVGA